MSHQGQHGCECGCHHGEGRHEGNCGCESAGGRETCGCGCESPHGGHHHRHGGCHAGFARRFGSRAERISELEAYLHDLEAEATAVREVLGDLRSEQV